LPLPIREEPFLVGPLFIPPIQLLGAGVSIGFLAAFGWFFLKSRKGIAMRAVADNQQAALATGINVERYFGVAWAMTGIVAPRGPAGRRNAPPRGGPPAGTDSQPGPARYATHGSRRVTPPPRSRPCPRSGWVRLLAYVDRPNYASKRPDHERDTT